MQSGVAFPHRHAHELPHLRPLMGRLQDVLAHPPQRAAVAVQASARAPRRGAWNVQVFGGMAGKSSVAAAVGLARRRGRPRARWQQANAYGPRWADLLEDAWGGAVEVSRFGHLPLNELEGLGADSEGPVAWMPGPGTGARALQAAAASVLALAREVPVLVRLPPRAPRAKALRQRLAAAAGVTLAAEGADPYPLLHGARAVLADMEGLALEAAAAGLPVALLREPGEPGALEGIGAELAERVPSFAPGDALRDWAWHPDPLGDVRWGRDLLSEPSRRANDAFAARLRAVAVEVAR